MPTIPDNLEELDKDTLVDLVEDLTSKNSDLDDELTDLRKKVRTMENRLEEAADVMADLGRIHNTPHCKRLWIEGN